MTSNSMELQEQIPDDIDGNVRNVPDLILAIIATFGGVAVLLYSQTLPTHPGGAYGPGLFPSILGVLSAVFGVLLGTFVSFRMRRERVSQRSLSAGHPAEATKLIKKTMEQPCQPILRRWSRTWRDCVLYSPSGQAGVCGCRCNYSNRANDQIRPQSSVVDRYRRCVDGCALLGVRPYFANSASHRDFRLSI